MLERASTVELRKALELAQKLTQAGILFVAVPILSEQDKADLGWLVQRQMDRLEKEVSRGN